MYPLDEFAIKNIIYLSQNLISLLPEKLISIHHEKKKDTEYNWHCRDLLQLKNLNHIEYL